MEELNQDIKDPTLEGVQGLRGLKGVGEESPMSEPQIDVSRLNRDWYSSLGTYPRDVRSTIEEIQLPEDFGKSKYDYEATNLEQISNLQDFRAEQQSGALKIINGISKGAVLAGTTFLNGTIGFLYGTGKAIATGDASAIWDNEIAQGLDAINKKSEELMPNYYTKYEQDNPFTISANFIGDKFIKNLGFAVGAIGSYMLGGGVGKAAVKGITRGLVGAKILAPTLSNIRTATNVGTAASSFLGGAVSAVGEASIEALGAADEFAEQNLPLLQETLRQQLTAAEYRYQSNKGTFIQTDAGIIDPAWLTYQEEVQKARQDYIAAYGKLQENRTKVGNGVVAAQVPLLMASNIFQFGKLFTKGFTGARALGKELTGEIGQYKTSKTLAKGVAKYIGNAAVEGSEEMGQRIISDISKSYYTKDTDNFYRQRVNPDAEMEVLNLMNETANVFKSTLSDASAWEEFTIGALTGALGIPGFRSIKNKETGAKQSPIYLRGGIQELLDYRKEMQEEQSLADELNSRVQTPEFLNYYQGLIRHKSYDAIMQDAALRDDRFDYKNAERAQLISDIIMFDKAGKLGDLQQYVKESTSALSDEDLDAIVDATSIKQEDKTTGPYIDKSGVAINTTEEGKQQMREQIAKNAEELSNAISEYQKIKGDIEFASSYNLTEDQTQELIYLKAMAQNNKSRINSIIEEQNSAIDETIKTILAVLEGDIQNVLSTEKTDIKDSTRKLTEQLQTLRTYQSLSTEAKSIALSDRNVRNSLIILTDVYAGKDISGPLKDIEKLRQAEQTFSSKFKEFMENPNKLEQAIEESKQETVKRKDKIKSESINNEIEKATNAQDIANIINNAEEQDKALDLIKQAANKGNKNAQDYLNSQSTKNGVLDAMASIDGTTQEDVEIASQVIDVLQQADASLNNTPIDQIEDVARSMGIPEDKLLMFSQALEDAIAEHQEVQSQNEDFPKMPEYNGEQDDQLPPTAPPQLLDEEASENKGVIIEGENTDVTVQEVKDANTPIIQGNTASDLPTQNTTNQQAINQSGDIITIIPYFDLNELKNGNFKLFKETNPGFSALFDFLVEKGAFEYVDTGKLKQGQTVKLAILQEFNNKVQGESWYNPSMPTIFMVTESGQIVGVLKSSNITPEIAAIRKEVTDSWKQQGTGVDYTHSTKFKVSKAVSGHVLYAKQVKPLADIDIPEIHLAIVKQGNLIGDSTTEGKIRPLKDFVGKEGNVYLLIPGADGTYIPTSIVMNNFNHTNWGDADNILNNYRVEGHRLNTLVAALNRYLPTIVNNPTSSWNSFYSVLKDILYLPDNVHFNIRKGTKSGKLWLFIEKAAVDQYGAELYTEKDGQRIRIQDSSFNNGSPISISLEGNIENTSKSIINALMDLDLRFNIDAKHLSNKAYIESIRVSNILSSNIEKGYSQGGYFSIEQEQQTEQQSETPTPSTQLGIKYQGAVNDDLFADDFPEEPTVQATYNQPQTQKQQDSPKSIELSEENKKDLAEHGVTPDMFNSFSPDMQNVITRCTL